MMAMVITIALMMKIKMMAVMLIAPENCDDDHVRENAGQSEKCDPALFAAFGARLFYWIDFDSLCCSE